MGKLPSQDCIERELLRLLASETGAMRTNAIYTILADQMGLTRSQRWGNPFEAKGSCWEFIVRQARRTLEEEGCLQSPRPGYWELTQAGRERAGHLVLDPMVNPTPRHMRH